MAQDNIIYAIDGESFLRTLRHVNDLLLKSAEISGLVVGETRHRMVACPDGSEIDGIFTEIKHGATNSVIIDIGFISFPVAEDDIQQGFYCINQFNESFHILSERQMDTFVHIYTECVNCLLITLASSNIYSDSESE